MNLFEGARSVEGGVGIGESVVGVSNNVIDAARGHGGGKVSVVFIYSTLYVCCCVAVK